jgi:hypothetical protein
LNGISINAVIDAFANVQCGQSVVVSLFGRNVLITAGPTPIVPAIGPGAPAQDPAPVKVPTTRPPILDPVEFPHSSVANILHELGEPVPVITLDDFLQRAGDEPGEPGGLGGRASLGTDVGHIFRIDGVGSVVMPARAVAPNVVDPADVDLGPNGF